MTTDKQIESSLGYSLYFFLKRVYFHTLKEVNTSRYLSIFNSYPHFYKVIHTRFCLRKRDNEDIFTKISITDLYDVISAFLNDYERNLIPSNEIQKIFRGILYKFFVTNGYLSKIFPTLEKVLDKYNAIDAYINNVNKWNKVDTTDLKSAMDAVFHKNFHRAKFESTDYLMLAFSWSHTKEGADFWNRIFEDCCNNLLQISLVDIIININKKYEQISFI